VAGTSQTDKGRGQEKMLGHEILSSSGRTLQVSEKQANHSPHQRTVQVPPQLMRKWTLGSPARPLMDYGV
jgi:hypothetical protein